MVLLWQLSTWFHCFATLGCTIIHWRLGRAAGRFRDYALYASSLILVENMTAAYIVMMNGGPCEKTTFELALRVFGRFAAGFGMTVWGLYLMGVLNGVHDYKD